MKISKWFPAYLNNELRPVTREVETKGGRVFYAVIALTKLRLSNPDEWTHVTPKASQTNVFSVYT